MTPHSTQVLISGAGPNGLALACLLARQNVAFRIVDKNHGRSEHSKAIGLQYRVAELLAQMGIVDRFLSAGASPTPVNMYEGGRKLVRLNFDLGDNLAGAHAFTPTPIILPQSQTEAILAERLGELGHSIEWKTELTSFRQDAHGVTAVLKRGDGPETVTSDYLVSCEGAHSRIRKLAGMKFRGKTYPLTFVLADLQVDWWLERTENHVWFHREGAFAALPLPRDNTWRLFFEISGNGDGLADTPTLEKVRALFAARTGNVEATIHSPSWMSVFRINCRMVDRYRRGRVFLAGDAAHIHSPTGGQGITTGMQDVANLAWKLAHVLKGAPDALLDTYEQERRPKAQEVLRETDRTTTLFFSKNPVTRLLRDAVVLPILRLPVVQRRMFQKLAQLHVNYRTSPVSVHAAGPSLIDKVRLRAGDRAPDVAFLDEHTGSRVTLFQLLTDFRPVLLAGVAAGARLSSEAEPAMQVSRALGIRPFILSTADASSPQAFTKLVDVTGDFSRFYGLNGDFACLVRPDGHLGLLQKPMRVEVFYRYLERIYDPRAIAAALANASEDDELTPSDRKHVPSWPMAGEHMS